MWFSCCERHRRLIPAASNLFRPLRVLGVLVILLSLTASPLFAKRKDDLVVLKNGDHITGEIKRIEHGTLYFKADYALEDIQAVLGLSVFIGGQAELVKQRPIAGFRNIDRAGQLGPNGLVATFAMGFKTVIDYQSATEPSLWK